MKPLATVKPDPDAGLDVLYTFRYMRGGIIALLLMLLFAVAYQSAVNGCILPSISAYYFTPARTVFVGSLFALGALLIVQKARSPEEDVLLDFSGFMAFVVAMVPTVPSIACGPTDGIPAAQVAASVRTSIWTLIVITVAAAVTRNMLRRRTAHVSRATPGSRIATMVCAAVLAVELIFFLLYRDRFIAVSHGIAAVTMVAGVIAVMVLNATYQPQHPRGQAYRRIYLGLAAALGVSLLTVLVLKWAVPGFGHVVLVIEVIVLLLFAAFWVTQTVELWQDEPQDIQDQVQQAPVATAGPAQSAGRNP